jgi:hypothetical protein
MSSRDSECGRATNLPATSYEPRMLTG